MDKKPVIPKRFEVGDLVIMPDPFAAGLTWEKNHPVGIVVSIHGWSYNNWETYSVYWLDECIRSTLKDEIYTAMDLEML